MADNKLLVEGNDDLYAIVGMMQAHISWPKDKKEAPVEIIPEGGVEKILNHAAIAAYLKASDTKRFGIVLDADDDAASRWESLRDCLKDHIPSIPASIPQSGFIGEAENAVRVGVWVMPDNSMSGMLETFLATLVPETSSELWDHAKAATREAKVAGAKFLGQHDDKANMHCWLAWSNPPGMSFGLALLKNYLDPKHKSGTAFVGWFRQLFEL